MSDPALLALGCGVSFIAIAGIYLGIRERFLFRDDESRSAPPHEASLVPVRVVPRAPERATRRPGR